MWLGAGRQLETLLEVAEPTVLVPLASLDGDIWVTGWRGEILYYPVEDFGVLPADVLQACVDDVSYRVAVGHRVAVFCMGGHGRTGYVGACLVGALAPEVEDPIAHLRRVYCAEAVESQEQVDAVADFLGRPDLKAHEPAKRPLLFSVNSQMCVYCDYYQVQDRLCLFDNTPTGPMREACQHYLPWQRKDS